MLYLVAVSRKYWQWIILRGHLRNPYEEGNVDCRFDLESAIDEGFEREDLIDDYCSIEDFQINDKVNCP